MPKIRILEQDSTTTIASAGIVNTVYVPALKPTDKTAYGPTLFTSADALQAANSNGALYPLSDPGDRFAYLVALHLLKVGYYVVFETMDALTSATWTRLKDKNNYDLTFLTTGDFPGKNGDEVTCAKERGDCVALIDHIKTIVPAGTATYADVVRNQLFGTTSTKVDNRTGAKSLAFTITADNTVYSFEKVTVGTTDLLPADYTSDTATKTVTITAENKLPYTSAGFNTTITYKATQGGEDQTQTFTTGKCVREFNLSATAFTAPTVTVAGTATTEFVINANAQSIVFDEAPADEAAIVITYTTANEGESCSDGEYAAAFTPWIKVGGSTEFGTNGLSVPGSYGYLFARANALKTAADYMAIAGPRRGFIPELLSVEHAYTEAEVNILTKTVPATEQQFSPSGDGVGISINPIYNVRPSGVLVYGNRTCRNNPAGSDGAAANIATSYLSVRVMVALIKKRLWEAARYYTFEQNSNSLWINFQARITPMLDDFKSGWGIAGYRFNKLTTTAKARLRASLDIVPIEPVEDFDLQVNLEDSLEVTEG